MPLVLLSDNPDYQLLRTILGIGPIKASTILAESGDLRRFRHHRQFLKFCGMDLATLQSGMFRGQTKLSKYGNARLRRTFWLAGQVAIMQRTNSFRDKFERYIAKDRHNAHLRLKVQYKRRLPLPPRAKGIVIAFGCTTRELSGFERVSIQKRMLVNSSLDQSDVSLLPSYLASAK